MAQLYIVVRADKRIPLSAQCLIGSSPLKDNTPYWGEMPGAYQSQPLLFSSNAYADDTAVLAALKDKVDEPMQYTYKVQAIEVTLGDVISGY